MVEDNEYSEIDIILEEVELDTHSISITKNILNEIKKKTDLDRSKILILRNVLSDMAFAISVNCIKYEFTKGKNESLKNNYIGNFEEIIMSGIPNEWSGEYSPIDGNTLANAYSEYKKNEWMQCNALDLIFLENFIAESFFVHFFGKMFKAYGTTKQVFKQVITKGNYFKRALYSWIVNPLKIFIGYMLIPYSSYWAFSKDIRILGWIMLVIFLINIVFIPIRIFYYFTSIKKIDQTYEKVIVASELAYRDMISSGGFNPKETLKRFFDVKSNKNLVARTEIISLLEDLIKRNDNFVSL